MSYNMATIVENRITFGPGRVFLGASGATPSTDVGAVEATMNITFKRTPMILFQGSPKQVVKKVATQEECDIELTGMEVNLVNLARAIGAGELSDSNKIMEFGGDMEFSDLALRFQHQTPAGGTVLVDVWTVNGSGESAVNFGEEWTKMPMVFSAQNALTDWAGATLADKKRLLKITIQDPPS
jgi:hypothetical protein